MSIEERNLEIVNGKEVWRYFFEKPKKNYNKYMYEMVNYPKHYLMVLVFSNLFYFYKNLMNEFS